ncbi:MAG: glycosyltransferase [Ruminococcaceae bacterium]|nr:glycosyltransferase [Oscillospiraceae bacterium]
MKKVLFVINDMDVGGIQKALLELLKALSNNEEYEVSLFCCVQRGAYLKRIPERICLLPENVYAKLSAMPLSLCKQQGIRFYLLRMFLSFWTKKFGKSFPAKVLCRYIGRIGEEYDVAVSYAQPIEEHAFANLTNEMVLSCVKARKKVTFVHCDFASYGGNTPANRKLYEHFDAVAAVSDSVGRRISEVIPGIKTKVKTVRNFCDCDEIAGLAEESPVCYQRPAFVTVARLSNEKGIMRCIPLFDRLKREGFNFEWHIVGDGPIRHQIETEIDRYGLAEDIILEGEQMNPYRYMKHAAFFLLPSFHEAAPVVFDEALALGLPVLTTKTLSAEEIVGNPGHGYVCEQTEEAIYQMLREALSGTLQYALHEKPNQALSAAQFDAVCG